MLPAHFSPCLLANHPLIEYLTSSTGVRVHKHQMKRVPTATRFLRDRLHRAVLPTQTQAWTLRHVHRYPAHRQDGRFNDARDKNLEV